MAGADPILTLPVPRWLPDGAGRAVPARLADRVMVLGSPGPGGLWLTTKGLGRFGLPELQALDVPFGIGAAWAAALTGIALRVVERWIEAIRDRSGAFVELPAVVELTGADVARAYGEEHGGTGPAVAVQLRPDPGPARAGDPFLTVGPPDGVPGSPGDYLTAACARLFGTWGCGPGP